MVLVACAKYSWKNHSPDCRPLESDPELIQRILTGDRHALAVLYERYLPSVWRYVCARLRGDEAGCRDVVSDTFLDAVRSLRSFDGQAGTVSGWLTGIARHKVADYRRSRSRAPGELVADPLAEGGDPAAQFAAEESREAVTAVLARLPDEQRQVLEWKYLDELSVREIAGHLDKTERAVEALLYRARQAFRAFHGAAQGERNDSDG